MDSLSQLSSFALRSAMALPKVISAEPSIPAKSEAGMIMPPSAGQVEALSQLLQLHQQHLSFSVDESSGVSVLRVIDTDSGDVIRQMPSASWLKLAQELAESTTGLLRDHA